MPSDVGDGMEHEDYLRDQAETYRQLAEKTNDLEAKLELLTLAAVCEEVADVAADRLTAG